MKDLTMRFLPCLLLFTLQLGIASSCSTDLDSDNSDSENSPDRLDATSSPDVDAGPAPDDGGFDLPGTENDVWSCEGTAGSTYPSDGVYYVTSFGCWTDSNGLDHGDGGDNCIPWCQSNAALHGTQAAYDELCDGASGPECERAVNWYAANADRYGCMTRLRVTNPDNGKSAVVVVLDRGPSCTIEEKVDFWVLDLSTPASLYLFGEEKSATEKGDVIVEVVDPSTPLGAVGP